MKPPGHALLVLAAGASRRLGEPKQLLQLGGQSLVRRSVRAGLATAPSQAWLVLGAVADAVSAEVADLPVRPVFCAGWQAGLGASLATGLGALDPDIDGALVLVCDQPALDARHLQALVAAWYRDPACAAASAYADVLGVPALLPRAWFAELAQGHDDRGARELLRRNAANVFAVPAPALAQDLDTPSQREDWQAGPSLGRKDPPE
ncbi:MAG TPA: nucleotidyltransferase family protein [Arenimonas sp.]|nr:nucleotidyltransferase family protein [Arenimonas sp.]